MKKRILLTLVIFAFMTGIASAASPLTRARLTSFIKDCRAYEDVEVFHMGGLATGALKGFISIAGADDPDIKEFRKVSRWVNGMSILEYDDCPASVREEITEKINRLLKGAELLMEASDNGERVCFYGTYDEKKEIVKDLILYSPDECSLICFFGRIPMNSVYELAK